MITVNRKERSVTVVFENTDTEDIVNYQNALLKIIKHYQYSDYGADAENVFYNVLSLFEELTPNLEQQKKGFTDETYIPVPKNTTTEQKKALINLIRIIKHPDCEIDVNQTVKAFIKEPQ